MARRITLTVVIGLVVVVVIAKLLMVKRNDATLRRNTGRLLVDQAMLTKHWEGWEGNQEFRSSVQDVAKSMSKQEYQWRFIKPNRTDAANAPRDEFEYALPERFTADAEKFAERLMNDGNEYQYYQPIYAEKSCLLCHAVVAQGKPQAIKDSNSKDVAEGDLMAIICIALPADSGTLNIESQ